MRVGDGDWTSERLDAAASALSEVVHFSAVLDEGERLMLDRAFEQVAAVLRGVDDVMMQADLMRRGFRVVGPV